MHACKPSSQHRVNNTSLGPSCAKLRLALAARVGCWLMPLQSYSSDPKYLHRLSGLLPPSQDAQLIDASM